MFEQYITGMLSNFDALPLDRIHNMLKMFTGGSEHKYDKDLEQLRGFLAKLISDEKLELQGNMYSLRKA